MKVDTFPEELPDRRWWPQRDRPRAIQVKRVLPFCMSPNGTRMHRVRTAVVYPPLWPDGVPRLVPTPWCGSCGTHHALFADPGEFEVCGTCEGRAIGAGQIEAPPDYDYGLLFSPRLPVARCGWEKGTHTAYYSRYGPCEGRGFATAVQGDEAIVVCRTHYRSAVSKGWAITEGVPLDANRS